MKRKTSPVKQQRFPIQILCLVAVLCAGVVTGYTCWLRIQTHGEPVRTLSVNWSGSGRWIYWVTGPEEPTAHSPCAVYVQRVEGGGRPLLLTSSCAQEVVMWHRKADLLACVEREGGNSSLSLRLWDPEERHSLELARFQADWVSPAAWQEQGQWVSVLCHLGGEGARDWLMLVDRRTKQVKKVEAPGGVSWGSDSLPVWSPDGERVVCGVVVGWASDWASFTDLLSFHLPDQTWHYFKTDNVLGQASWEKIPIASGQPAFDPAIQSSADDFIQDRFGQGFVAWLCIHITPGYGPLYSPYWVDLNKGSLIEIKGAVNRILEDRRGRYWSLSPGGKHVAWIRFPSEASGETTPGTGEIWVASFQIEEWRARLKESLADPSHEWSEQELTKALEKLYPKTERRKDHPCEKIAAIESLYKQQAPAWCPDGQRVAVVQANSTGDRILIIHLPTKRVTVLTKRPDD